MANKKIALCISGEPRNSMVCFPYIYESFIASNPQYDIDVYIHSFKPFRAIPLYNPKNVLIESIDEFEVYKHYLNQFNFDLIDSHSTPFKNTILMHYGISKCFNLTKDIKYDYYIRCRPDIKFNSLLDLEYIIKSLEVNKNDIWVPQNYNNTNWEISTNDQLAVCNFKSFKVYCEVINHLGELLTETNSYYPEGLLWAHLNKNSVKIEKGYVDAVLVRKVFFSTHPQKNNYFEY